MSEPPPPPLPPPSAGWPSAGQQPLQPDWSPKQSTAGLRKAAVILFWCTTGSTALLIVATIYRRSVWTDFRGESADLDDLDAADGAVGAAAGLQLALGIATLIVVSIWSLRTARNARSSGAPVSPGWACGGWYLPFANLVVPFVQLRRIMRHGQQSASPVNRWQGLIIVTAVASGPLRRLGDTESATTSDELSSRLSAQIWFAVISTLLLAAMSYVASQATREVDAVSSA